MTTEERIKQLEAELAVAKLEKLTKKAPEPSLNDVLTVLMLAAAMKKGRRRASFDWERDVWGNIL